MAAAPQRTSTCIVSQGRKRTMTVLPDGSQLEEEHDAATDELLMRRCRTKSSLGVWSAWRYEVGEPVKAFNPETDLLGESASNPILVRKDTDTHFEWRVRNVPFPPEVFQVTVEKREGAVPDEIVIRTSNKRYFKRLSVPEQPRLSANGLAFRHENATLIVTHPKDDKTKQRERELRDERKRAAAQPKDGDVDCRNQ